MNAAPDPDLLPPPGGAAVLAVSGGLDSTVLARTWAPLLQRWGVSVTLAHVDHQLRGEDSDGDRAFVVALAAELGVSSQVAIRPPSDDAVAEVGLEAALRCSRRRFLRELAERVGARHVYLAHHRDDQIETLLLRLMEGTPAERVTGMRRRHGIWARPLLGVPRDRLRALAMEQGWTWREDATNAASDRPRTRIRNAVLPSLRAADPRFDDTLLAAAEAALARRDALDRRVDALAERAVRMRGDGGARVDAVALRGVEPDVAIGLLQRICDPGDAPRRPPSRAALAGIVEPPPGPARRFDLGGGWTAREEGGELRLLRDLPLPAEPPTPPSTAWTEPTADWDQGRWRLAKRVVDLSEAAELLTDPDAGRRFALFDPAVVGGDLSVVAAPAGRRMSPYGLAGSATVRHLLAEAGIPRSARSGRPAVVDRDGRILWLPGVRAASFGALDKHSKQALLLYTEQSPEDRGSKTGSHAESP